MKWSVISFALLVLASCQNKEYQPDPSNVGFFPEDTGEVRKPVQFTDAMAAAGARADATLGKHHFDGPRLNSLGEEKLALMLKDEHAPAPLCQRRQQRADHLQLARPAPNRRSYQRLAAEIKKAG